MCMRFLLINPFYPISETPSPPLGLAYLAAVLAREGITVKMTDFVVTPLSKERLQAVISDFKPDMAGITAVTMTLKNAIEIMKDVKRLSPGTFTVIGGPHVTFSPEDALNSGIDAAVLGEGEETLIDLVRNVQDNRPLHGVAGIAFMENGAMFRTSARPFIQNIDSLPMPDRSIIPMVRYKALNLPVSMTTSRGCPFQCIFCVGRKMVGARVRYRSPKNVADEFEFLASQGFPQINIADDLFTANHDHCNAFCDEILRRGIKTKWTSFARVDTVSVPLLEKMKEAGLTAVSFGVETGNAEILKTIRKNITKDLVIEAVGKCLKAGVTPMASFILGLPGETPDTMRESLEFSQKLTDMGCPNGFHLLAPFPGTSVRDEHKKYGIRILSDDWNDYHANRAIVETQSVSAAMMNEKVIDWENKYLAYLGDIQERMKSNKALPHEIDQLKNLERTVLLYDLMMDRALEDAGILDDASFQEDAPLSGLIEYLAKRYEGKRGKSEKELKQALEFAYNADYIQKHSEGKGHRYTWSE